jgi:signal transduction histidine kinase
VLWALILTNAALTLLLAGAAWFIVARMMWPMALLTDHLERSHSGQVAPIPEAVVARVARDYRRPFAAMNRLATAVAEREALDARLAEEERLASLGRLASGMAHEIKNPLGGLFNAIDTLKRHDGDAQVRRTTIDLVERGLKGIRDVVRAALMSYRAERDDRLLRPEDVEDLRLLISPEARRRGVQVRWDNELRGEVALRATGRAPDHPQPGAERLPGKSARHVAFDLDCRDAERSRAEGRRRGSRHAAGSRGNADGDRRPVRADRQGHGARPMDDEPPYSRAQR